MFLVNMLKLVNLTFFTIFKVIVYQKTYKIL